MMEPNGLRTLLTGRGLLESPRWHGDRLAMSRLPKAPAAPRLRAVREAWLRPVIGQLEADPDISAVGFVGSIGRWDADDWSEVALAFDARHNAPRGAGSVGVHYVIDGLPFNADWYVYPDSQGGPAGTP